MGRGSHFEKCFFLVPASLAVQGDIMLSVGETIEGFLKSGRSKMKEGGQLVLFMQERMRREKGRGARHHNLEHPSFLALLPSYAVGRKYQPRGHSLHEESLLSISHLRSHGDRMVGGRERVAFLSGREKGEREVEESAEAFEDERTKGDMDFNGRW